MGPQGFEEEDGMKVNLLPGDIDCLGSGWAPGLSGMNLGSESSPRSGSVRREPLGPKGQMDEGWGEHLDVGIVGSGDLPSLLSKFLTFC